MKKIKANKVFAAFPLLLGTASVIAFAVYFYSANHAPYNYVEVIFAAPVFSLAGLIISLLTGKSRKSYPALWTSGLIVCLLSFLICALVLLLLAWIASSMFNGTWL